MSKKFKKKIEDICGLAGLDWKARQERAEQILCNNNWKQQLCNDFQGLSFRDLELHLQSVATERQKKEEGVERKLAHRDNHEKSVRRDSTKSTPGTTKPAARTLAEILRQVYGPRAEHGTLSPEERADLKSFGKRARLRILPDAPDDDDQARE